ncbi:MAG: hypothetical protein HRT35_38600 [Algicola sp.]|nr:hypothetical protein [Algicola sp.]
MKALIYLFFLVVFANLPLAAQQITITHVSAEGERNVYFIKLLELALEKSKAPTEQFHLQALPYLHQ